MNETLQYWAGISEHSCESSTPIGACLACDLAMIQDTLIAVTAQRDRLAEALRIIDQQVMGRKDAESDLKFCGEVAFAALAAVKIAMSRCGYYDRFAIARELERELANMEDQRDAAIWCHEKCRQDRLRVIAQRDRLAEALQSIADCDWVITLPDRMDAVRDIARRALAAVKGESP